MTDEEYFTLMGIKPGGSPQRDMRRFAVIDGRGLRRPTVTAAVARGNLLAIATVEHTGTALRLRPRATGCHELVGRDQSDTVRFIRHVTDHLSAARVRHILLRVAPETGPYSAKGAVYRIEATLHLIPDLTIEVVHTQRIGGWVRGTDIAIPEPEVAGAKYIAAQRSAIQTAAYGLRGA